MTRSMTLPSNSQVVTIAVSELGGATKSIDIEDIAIRAYQIAPEKFSWRNYPERIDLRVVQYALKDAASKRKGEPLLKGSLKHGYMLTSLGLDWIENNQLASLNSLQGISRKQSTADKLAIEQARLLSSSAFIKFQSGNMEEIKYVDFQEFARINDYFPEHAREKRYLIVENAIRGNPILEELWMLLIKRFVKGNSK